MSLVLSTLILLGSPSIGRAGELPVAKVATGTLAPSRTSGLSETCVVAETAADYERALGEKPPESAGLGAVPGSTAVLILEVGPFFRTSETPTLKVAHVIYEKGRATVSYFASGELSLAGSPIPSGPVLYAAVRVQRPAEGFKDVVTGRAAEPSIFDSLSLRTVGDRAVRFLELKADGEATYTATATGARTPRLTAAEVQGFQKLWQEARVARLESEEEPPVFSRRVTLTSRTGMGTFTFVGHEGWGHSIGGGAGELVRALERLGDDLAKHERLTITGMVSEDGGRITSDKRTYQVSESDQQQTRELMTLVRKQAGKTVTVYAELLSPPSVTKNSDIRVLGVSATRVGEARIGLGPRGQEVWVKDGETVLITGYHGDLDQSGAGYDIDVEGQFAEIPAAALTIGASRGIVKALDR
jgi:hypothetical protein